MLTVQVQPSLLEVLGDVAGGSVDSDTFWVNVINGEELVEETVSVALEGNELMFTNANGLEFTHIGNSVFSIVFRGEYYTIDTPKEAYNTGITSTAFDVSPTNGKRFLLGADDGTLNIKGDTDAPEFQDKHLSTVTSAKFFPSGQVALSVGLDLQIKLWDLSTGSGVKNHRAQKKRITDVVMIDRGKNFYTSSLDGTVVLWDCAIGKVDSVQRKESLRDGVSSIQLDGHTLFMGHESGVVTLLDTTTKDELMNISGGSEVVGMTAHEHSLTVAHSNGHIKQWDRRNLTTPLTMVPLSHEVKNIGQLPNDDNLITVAHEGFVSRFTRDLHLHSQVGAIEPCDNISNRGQFIGNGQWIYTL